MFTIDGVAWSIPCDIKRTAELRESEASGYLLNREYYADVVGTYLQYEVTLVPNPASMADYYAMYELLTQATGDHTFILPYNGETVTLRGRISSPSDVYVRRGNGAPYWKGMRFTVTSNTPKE